MKKSIKNSIILVAILTFVSTLLFGCNNDEASTHDTSLLGMTVVTDDYLLNRISIDFAYERGRGLTTIKNIQHSPNAYTMTDTVVADYIFETDLYTKSETATYNLELKNGKWSVMSKNETNVNAKWKFDGAIGTWQVTCPGDNYTVEFKVLNIDDINNIALIQGRHAKHGFIAGGENGWDLIQYEEYTEPFECEMQFYEDENGLPNVAIAYYDFYDSVISNSYSLYANPVNLYIPHVYKKYIPTKID